MKLKKSLKPLQKSFLRKRLQPKENLYALIRHLYTHLSELSNEEILDYYSVRSLQELNEHIEHVKEVLKKESENYEEEREALNGCFCLDSRGDFKYLYESKKEAQKQITHTFQTKRIKLTLYPCPFHCGWHLSKV